MATARKTKVALEVLFARAELKGIPERALLKSRNMVQVDMIWPRSGIAKKSAMREAVFKKGVCDFTGEPWTGSASPNAIPPISVGSLHRLHISYGKSEAPSTPMRNTPWRYGQSSPAASRRNSDSAQFVSPDAMRHG